MTGITISKALSVLFGEEVMKDISWIGIRSLSTLMHAYDSPTSPDLRRHFHVSSSMKTRIFPIFKSFVRSCLYISNSSSRVRFSFIACVIFNSDCNLKVVSCNLFMEALSCLPSFTLPWRYTYFACKIQTTWVEKISEKLNAMDYNK
jgi:hypothetical protein